MRLDSKLKLRTIAGESIVTLRSDGTDDMTKVISLNRTSRFLWDAFAGKDFTEAEVADALLNEYGIEREVAERDAASWVQKLSELGVLE